MTTQESIMTTQEVASRFYALAQEGKWDQIQEELFSDDVRSVEPPHAQGLPSVEGKEKLKEKAKQWESMIEKLHGEHCSEPQVAGNYFTCIMSIDATMKGQKRQLMEEVCVYEVKDGKIVCEQFFF